MGDTILNRDESPTHYLRIACWFDSCFVIGFVQISSEASPEYPTDSRDIVWNRNVILWVVGRRRPTCPAGVNHGVCCIPCVVPKTLLLCADHVLSCTFLCCPDRPFCLFIARFLALLWRRIPVVIRVRSVTR